MSTYLKAGHLAAGILMSIVVTLPAMAQYSGPSEIRRATVAEILDNPVDDQDVQLRGRLLRQTSDDEFIFSDGTGEIVVELETKHFAGQPVDEKTEVELIGEVETKLKRPPEIEVDSIRVVK
jgi:uncharacterized protein (TIGR00156 family)